MKYSFSDTYRHLVGRQPQGIGTLTLRTLMVFRCTDRVDHVTRSGSGTVDLFVKVQRWFGYSNCSDGTCQNINIIESPLAASGYAKREVAQLISVVWRADYFRRIHRFLRDG